MCTTTKSIGWRILRNLFRKGKHASYITGGNFYSTQQTKIDEIFLYFNKFLFYTFFRFTEKRKSERHPLAWMPFGSGPRTCVGLRLAQLEGKMTIIRMLKKYSFVPSATQEIPIQCVEGATILPKDGVNVRAVMRSS